MSKKRKGPRRRRAAGKRSNHAPKRRRPRRQARRSNPTSVILANPHRKGKGRRRRRPRSNPSRRRARAFAPRRRRIRRRSNPSGGLALQSLSWGQAIRFGAFGGAGIIVARMTGGLYTEYVSKYVLGDETDPSSWRAILNEALRLLAMGVATYAVSRAARKMRLRPLDCQAIAIGGLAETGRQAIGLLVDRVSPDTDRKRYGLDGPVTDAVEYLIDDDGHTYAFDNRTQQYYALDGIVPETAFDGLVPESAFAGVR